MVVLFGTELLLELPVVLTNEQYADIHFSYGFYDESGRLLQWNTTSDIQITEFRTTVHFRMYTDL
jgi:hypothetical protein